MSLAIADFLAFSPTDTSTERISGIILSHRLHRACRIDEYLGRLLFVRLSCSLLASDHTCQLPKQSEYKGDLHSLGG